MLLQTFEPQVRNQIDVLDTEEWNAIHSGMRMVVENTKEFDGFPIEAAGKTGTAWQNLKQPNHALFVGYAPYDDRKSRSRRVSHTVIPLTIRRNSPGMYLPTTLMSRMKMNC